ncbi:shikimate dehydrogenase [Paraburkholderia sp. BR13444]|uniref:shikimate dehydrogenase n=1 Tax=Paraburkholderia sp. BR13444 TaxID=3236997 RepID=UPI0034D00FA1
MSKIEPSALTTCRSDVTNGATRVYFIIGDPIAQVRSPASVTAQLREAGKNAIVVPAHVRPADLKAFLAGIGPLDNVDGIIATVPHKFSVLEFCDSLGSEAQSVGAANVLRRGAKGRWRGDMFDGIGMVRALAGAGFTADGKRALLLGAGGAGTAISHALVSAGIGAVAIFDPDHDRRERLTDALNERSRARAIAWSESDGVGTFDLLVNASSIGLRENDPAPIDLAGAQQSIFIADVITGRVTPLVAQARDRGYATVTGDQMFDEVCLCMFAQVCARMVSFFLHD